MHGKNVCVLEVFIASLDPVLIVNQGCVMAFELRSQDVLFNLTFIPHLRRVGCSIQCYCRRREMDYYPMGLNR